MEVGKKAERCGECVSDITIPDWEMINSLGDYLALSSA